MKLTIMSAWRVRLSRVKRWNCRVLVLTLPSISLSPLLRLRGGGAARVRLARAVRAGRRGGLRAPLLLEPPLPRLLRLLCLPELPPHLQGTRQPQQRVRASHDERADEESGHPPERPEEPRVRLRVVVGRVAQV